ncbi:MAG TPA: DUF4384 domain-containing protein [Oculatellaceae cyanobacterium]
MKRFVPFTVASSFLIVATAGIAADKDVRGMYVEQEKNQTVQKNTGICYWLELDRDGEKKHCSNKTSFHNGDKLRIHVKPNVDGYAYILMLQGSKGDKSVLFPQEELGDNKIKAGQWIALPVGADNGNAWLKFDKHPGIEVVRMIVSRKKIDPAAQLHGGSVVIASNASDDKVPDGTLVTISVSKDSKLASNSRNLSVVQDAKPKEEGETTVVGDANKPLAVDITLDHSKGSN